MDITLPYEGKIEGSSPFVGTKKIESRNPIVVDWTRLVSEWRKPTSVRI